MQEPRNIQLSQEIQTKILHLFGNKMAAFLRNIKKYSRDTNGAYKWAWNGTEVLIRISVELYKQLDKDMGYPGNDNIIKLFSTKGVFLGTVKLWNPYAYPDLFVVLDIAEKYYYDPHFPILLARMAGYEKPVTFDMSLLEIQRPDNTFGEIIL